MQGKSMNLLCRSGKLLSAVSIRSVLLTRTEAFESACSTPLSLSLPHHFTASLPSCQRWRHSATSTSFFDIKRCYSESEKSRNSESSGVIEGDSHIDSQKLDKTNEKSSLSQRSSETFGLDVLVSLLRQENAADLCVIKVPEHIKYSEYFIVVSGVSPRHLRAMALYAIKVYKFLKKAEDPNVKIEGKDAEDWMCIDFGNMVVHFMLPETREVYELEKLWTLRSYDEQLRSIPAETLPEDFILDVEVTK